MCVRVCACVCVGGGYFADVLSYWLVQTLGEGQSQTILSPAVGKSRETKRERERVSQKCSTKFEAFDLFSEFAALHVSH